ncbi:hypothetical protein CDES_02150 [Corynebacterium deserti GIMN1.010]|uniref:Uncharacterized protein n=1 Tax=Corynebacterium deserti GIMN1.010 TaxID=931089 RepID=A0A0M4CN17_9CORY|nr:hypothetical protein [Corynebacterium deserti]ALC04892.1 hypothetical protein CDES_02150 [Corynebacterium deserti GIMN1.010]
MSSPLPTQSAFDNLYPDIDPTSTLPITAGERLAMSVAVATLAFGAASGDLLITGAGLALVLFATLVPAGKTGRRIRREARARFPHQPWAEQEILSARRLNLVVPAVWVAIATLSFTAFWLVDGMWGPTLVAVIAAVLAWFTPGISSSWERQAALQYTP